MSYELWQREGTGPDAARQSAPSGDGAARVSCLWDGLGVAEGGKQENQKREKMISHVSPRHWFPSIYSSKQVAAFQVLQVVSKSGFFQDVPFG